MAGDDFQPLGIGAADYLVIGMSPNTVTYKGDSGQMFTLSGYNKTFSKLTTTQATVTIP